MSTVISLAEIAVGLKVRIVQINSSIGLHFSKLAAFGLLPGTVVMVLQREPVIIVAIDHTCVAIDKKLATAIMVVKE